jgi:SulP family sulfate permease
MKRLVPVWLTGYRRDWLAGDLTAGLVVTVMLIPQSLAYAMLAGLPLQMGLYASVLPVIAYALIGSSMTLAVGPVAVASLMTASALAPLAPMHSAHYAALAMQLSLLSGLMLLAFGVLRLGFLAHFLSHPVISGFISGAAVLIAIGQIRHLLGVKIEADDVVGRVLELAGAIPDTNPAALAIGLGSVILLTLARRSLPGWLSSAGMTRAGADLAARFAPMLVVILATIAVMVFRLDETHGVAVVGTVPAGLPGLAPHAVFLDWSSLGDLIVPALLISVVGFVESVAVAQSFALKRQQRIDANREFLGLGAANVASAVSGGLPVTGGLARSVVNFSAGANTPLAGVICAVLIGLTLIFFTPVFKALPQAVLAATILVAITGLIDIQALRHAWTYDRADAITLAATAVGVIFIGVELGIVIGVVLSLASIVWRGSRPHIAVVGRVPGTEHFRNVERHSVQTTPDVLVIRIDESLLFTNAMQIRDWIDGHLAEQSGLKRIVISFAGVNQMDTTGLEMLDALDKALCSRGILLEFAEVKGPVMDKLKATTLGAAMKTRVHMSLHDALSDAV